MSFRILKPGVLATVQDLGRPGHASLGVPEGGAADRASLVLANRLVGNRDDAAGVEMALVGCTIGFEHAVTIALAGATPADAPLHQLLRVNAGDTLALGPLTRGVRTYLGVAGGIDVPLVLASRGTHVPSGLGGLEGRPLRAGDVLQFGRVHAAPAPPIDAGALAALHARTHRTRLRVVIGPHAELLGRAALDALLAGEFIVSDRSDRVGLRLTGPPLAQTGSNRGELITEPTVPGAVQVPPDGSPIILGPDAPVTGGYPVIASVIGADLPALGQLAPRERVGFERISSVDALREYRALLAAIDACLPGAASPPPPPPEPRENTA